MPTTCPERWRSNELVRRSRSGASALASPLGLLNGAFAWLVLGAMVRLEEGFAAALALVQRGIRLDTNCTDGYLVSAYLMEKAERDADAVFMKRRWN